MAKDRVKGGWSTQELEEFRSVQEEMLQLSREYSRARQAVWAEETGVLLENWNGFAQEWQGTMEQMSALATNSFEEMAARGEAAGSRLTQAWQSGLTNLSGEVEDWGKHFLQTLAKVASAWGGAMSGGGTSGAGSGLFSFLGAALDFGGWFHQGGIVAAHQGMVVSPGPLMGDEQLILAQTGEGILPRESMARLGEDNFESLRTGQFDRTPGKTAPRYDITIQVQSLDAAGVAGLDWDRLVQRHLLPALQREAGRRW